MQAKLGSTNSITRRTREQYQPLPPKFCQWIMSYLHGEDKNILQEGSRIGGTVIAVLQHPIKRRGNQRHSRNPTHGLWSKVPPKMTKKVTTGTFYSNCSTIQKKWRIDIDSMNASSTTLHRKASSHCTHRNIHNLVLPFAVFFETSGFSRVLCIQLKILDAVNITYCSISIHWGPEWCEMRRSSRKKATNKWAGSVSVDSLAVVMTLGIGKEIVRARVSMFQPKTSFRSDGVASAKDFVSESG